MKLIPAIFFISVGIWAAYTYPEVTARAYEYILYGLDWLKSMIGSK